MENNKERLIIVIHGFKRPNVDDFENFNNYANDKLRYKVINFTYYDNLDKKTLKWWKFKKEIDKVFLKYKDHPVTIFGYSAGATAAIHYAAKYDNVDRIIALVPACKIIFWDWIGKLLKTHSKVKEMKKRLGKEKYKRLKTLRKKSSSNEKHPVRIVLHMNLFRKQIIMNYKKLKNKELSIIFASNDEIVHREKTIKYIHKHLDFESNKITIDTVDKEHMTMIEKIDTEFYDRIINFLNNDK